MLWSHSLAEQKKSVPLYSLVAPSQLFFFYIGGEEKWSGSARAPASNEIHNANCNNNTRHVNFCRRILQCGRVSQRVLNYHVTGESNLIGTQL